MPLGTEVALGPGDIVLDGNPDPASPMERGTLVPHFRGLRTKASLRPCKPRTMSIVSNDWTDQDTTWYGDRLRPRGHFIRWGPRSHSFSPRTPILRA